MNPALCAFLEILTHDALKHYFHSRDSNKLKLCQVNCHWLGGTASEAGTTSLVRVL